MHVFGPFKVRTVRSRVQTRLDNKKTRMQFFSRIQHVLYNGFGRENEEIPRDEPLNISNIVHDDFVTSIDTSQASSVSESMNEVFETSSVNADTSDTGIDFRRRVRNISLNSKINRDSYNSISRASLRVYTMVMNHVDAKDWKIINGKCSGEDVALVISPHHHLVDDAWRKIRKYVTDRKLVAGRQKLTDIEKQNVVPKIKRMKSFLVVVANNRNTLNRVMAAERLRLGYVDPPSLREQANGLQFVGPALSPSTAPIRFNKEMQSYGPVPETFIGALSPANHANLIHRSGLSQSSCSSPSTSIREPFYAPNTQSSQETIVSTSSVQNGLSKSVKRVAISSSLPTDRQTRARREAVASVESDCAQPNSGGL